MENPVVFPLYFGSSWTSPEGTRYDLTIPYRDTDGLLWRVCGWEFYFLRPPVPLLECYEEPSLKTYSLVMLEEFHGPLRPEADTRESSSAPVGTDDTGGPA